MIYLKKYLKLFKTVHMWISRLLATVFVLIFSFALRAQDMESIQLAQQYFQQGEIEKSLSLFRELAKKEDNHTLIHNQYLEILSFANHWDEAEKYLNRRIRKEDKNPYLLADRGILLQNQNNPAAQKDFDKAIELAVADPRLIRTFATYLANKQLLDQSIKTYITARSKRGNQREFAIELAMIYRLNGNKDKMVSEYLNYLDTNPSALQFVQSSLQNVLTEPDDLDALELLMLDKIQSNPANQNYAELLIWIYIQRKDFQNAFIQARAADRRFEKEGIQLLETGLIAIENEEYDHALTIFEYIMRAYPNTPQFVTARRYQINAREKLVKNTFPVNKEAIKKLVAEYQDLLQIYGLNKNTQEAAREKALLHAFYLDEIDTAIQLLSDLIQNPQTTSQLKSKSKQDLGDLYILKGESWESTLLYSQVEKAEKESALGHEAKLRNAKLSFYNGNFTLAMGHLDVLKKATTREIANDAMALSLLIKTNMGYDSNTVVLQRYANAELLVFTQKLDQAKDTLQNIIEENPDHSIIDESLWLWASIEQRQGNFKKAIELLNKIANEFPYDVLSDDALYKIGVIQQVNLKDRQSAMDTFEQLIKKYPGSIYSDDARKRYRILRGDFIN